MSYTPHVTRSSPSLVAVSSVNIEIPDASWCILETSSEGSARNAAGSEVVKQGIVIMLRTCIENTLGTR